MIVVTVLPPRPLFSRLTSKRSPLPNLSEEETFTLGDARDEGLVGSELRPSDTNPPSLGKGVNEFRKAKNEWEQDIQDVMNQEPLEDHDFDQKASSEKETEKVNSEEEKQAAS